MSWLNILGKAVATALLGLEDATQALSNPASIPSDIAQFASGVIQIWEGAASAGTAPPAVTAAYQTHVAASKMPQ